MSDALRWVDLDGTFHELCKIMFLVGNDLLSEGTFDPGDHPEMRYRRGGVAYVCIYCGDIWGRAILLNSRGEQEPFDVAEVTCEGHPDRWNVPGSLLGGRYNEHYLPLLSPRAIRREFIVHHDEWTRVERGIPENTPAYFGKYSEETLTTFRKRA